MSKLILSNDQSMYEKGLAHLKGRGLKLSNDDSKVSNLYFNTFKKRFQDDDNILVYPNGDYIAYSGTFIYDGDIGVKGLDKICNTFKKDNNVKKLRAGITGNYLFSIKIKDIVTVFVDKYQILKSYYHISENKICIANSLSTVASMMNYLQEDYNNIIQESFMFSIVGNETIIQNIYQLNGNEYIELNSITGSFEHRSIEYEKLSYHGGDTIEYYVKIMASRIKEHAGMILKVFGDEICINMTGGLDSRTILAAFLSVGANPKLLYGVGNDSLTNTKANDLGICKLLAEKYKLELNIMDWSSNNTISQDWDDLFIKNGFSYKIYGGAAAVFNNYEGLLPKYPKFMEFGYFGEALREREWTENRKSDTFTLDEFLSEYYMSPFINEDIYSDYDQLYMKIKNEFLESANIYKIKHVDQTFSNESMNELRWITARKADSIMVNYMNNNTYSYSILSDPEIHEMALSLPLKYRVNSKFQLELIHELQRDTLEIPIYSHGQRLLFDSSTKTIKHAGLGAKIKMFIRMKYGNHFYVIIRHIYKKYLGPVNRISKNSKDSRGEVEKISYYINKINSFDESNSPFKINMDKYKGRLGSLVALAQSLQGINTINKKQ
jgi:hypothetical protein